MLNNQDFAQSAPKSPAKRRLQLVGKINLGSGKEIAASDLDRAIKLLQETIVKIEGAYAPTTIRAYRADFNDFIHFLFNLCFQFISLSNKRFLNIKDIG